MPRQDASSTDPNRRIRYKDRCCTLALVAAVEALAQVCALASSSEQGAAAAAEQWRRFSGLGRVVRPDDRSRAVAGGHAGAAGAVANMPPNHRGGTLESKTNFFAAGEFSLAYGITAFCASVLLRQQLGVFLAVIMSLSAVALTHSYEASLFLGAFLAFLSNC